MFKTGNILRYLFNDKYPDLYFVQNVIYGSRELWTGAGIAGSDDACKCKTGFLS